MAKLSEQTLTTAFNLQRLTNPYSRLCTLLLRVAEFQPTVAVAMLNLLTQTTKQGQAAVDAAQASVQEIRRDWKLS